MKIHRKGWALASALTIAASAMTAFSPSPQARVLIPSVSVPASTYSAQPVASTREVLADYKMNNINYSKSGWPNGSPEVVIVNLSDSTGLAAATPLAKKLKVPLILVGGQTGDDAALNEVTRLAPSKAYLVGDQWSPKTTFRQAVNARVQVQEWIAAPGGMEIGSAVSPYFTNSSAEAFAAFESSPGDLALASTASALQNSPVFITSSTVAMDSKAITEMKRLGVKTLFHLGNPSAATGAQLKTAGISLVPVDDASLSGRSAKMMQILEAKNVDSRRLIVAAESRPLDALVTSYGNSREGAFPLFTSSYSKPNLMVEELARGWASEVRLSRVLGPNTVISTDYTAALNGLISVPRATTPTLHVLSVSKTSTGASNIAFSAFANAKLYQAFDLAGNKSYEGAATQFTLPAQDSTFKLKALDANRTVLAERDLRVSQSSAEGGLESRVVVSTESVKSRFSWAETTSTPRPRTIQRSEASRAADGSAVLSSPKVVARTCGTGFTDTTRVAGKEYVYEVIQTGTITKNICSSTTPTTAVREPAQILTSLRTPSIVSNAQVAALGQNSDSAIPSSTEAAFLSAGQAANASSDPTSDTRAVSLPWRFRYQTFIADEYVRPARWDTQVFDGNNRGFGAWIDRYKTRVDMDFTFDSARQISAVRSYKDVGLTYEFHCSKGSYNDCIYVKSARASDAGILISGKPYSTVAGSISHNVPIPIDPHAVLWGTARAPAISYGVQYIWTRYGFGISGWHDGAPSHEIWGGYIPGEYIPIMTHDRNCAFALGLSGLCSMNINIKV